MIIFRVDKIKYNFKKSKRSCFFYCTELLIFYGNHVALVSTFTTRGVCNFITKEANIPVNLVPLFNDVLFLFCRFLKSGVTNGLKSPFLWKSKKKTELFIQNREKHCCSSNVSLVNICMEDRHSYNAFLKKSNIWVR